MTRKPTLVPLLFALIPSSVPFLIASALGFVHAVAVRVEIYLQLISRVARNTGMERA